jgi:hypothetical protein
MRYRERRRQDAQKKKRRMDKLARRSNKFERVVINPDGTRSVMWYSDDGTADYARKNSDYRGGKKLKTAYKRKLRNGRRKMEEFSGSRYKKMSGDYFYDSE